MSTVAVLALTIVIHLQAAGGSACPSARAETPSPPALAVLFFTTSWCDPCRAVSPFSEKLARKYEKRVKLVSVDCDPANAPIGQSPIRELSGQPPSARTQAAEVAVRLVAPYAVRCT
jgi:thiol-disulfide isomerase/thioredoxin